MHARVLVTLRRGVLDPAGQAVRASLNHLGFGEVKDARIGKVIEFEIEDMPEDEARRRLEAMAKQLLANTVIEDFAVELR
jgi:phosphoribosylformylglycinamidine synthase